MQNHPFASAIAERVRMSHVGFCDPLDQLGTGSPELRCRDRMLVLLNAYSLVYPNHETRLLQWLTTTRSRHFCSSHMSKKRPRPEVNTSLPPTLPLPPKRMEANGDPPREELTVSIDD